MSNRKRRKREAKVTEVERDEMGVPVESTLTPITTNKVVVADLGTQLTKEDNLEVEAQAIKIVLPLQVYQELMAYTRLVDDEINGLGLVERINDVTFKVTEIFLLEQKVTRASCEIGTTAMVKLMDELIKAGKNPSMLRFWWHSHNTMGATWSLTDEETGKKFAGSEYLISIVTTHSGEMRARINIYTPIDLSLNNVPIMIEHPPFNANVVDECEAKIKELVKKEITYINYQQPYNPAGFGTGLQAIDKFRGVDTERQPNLNPTAEDNSPWGKEFIESGVRYLWNDDLQQYQTFDAITGQELAEWEIRQRGAVTPTELDPYNTGGYYD